jgi:hypothetical protein
MASQSPKNCTRPCGTRAGQGYCSVQATCAGTWLLLLLPATRCRAAMLAEVFLYIKQLVYNIICGEAWW